MIPTLSWFRDVLQAAPHCAPYPQPLTHARRQWHLENLSFLAGELDEVVDSGNVAGAAEDMVALVEGVMNLAVEMGIDLDRVWPMYRDHRQLPGAEFEAAIRKALVNQPPLV